MHSAGNAGRIDQRHQQLIVAHAPVAITFANIRVDVDLHVDAHKRRMLKTLHVCVQCILNIQRDAQLA
jgi:hypothetical protein